MYQCVSAGMISVKDAAYLFQLNKKCLNIECMGQIFLWCHSFLCCGRIFSLLPEESPQKLSVVAQFSALFHFHGSGNRKYILQSFAHLLFLQKQDNYFFLFQPSVYELIRQPNFASLPIIVEDFVKDSGATFSGTSLLLTSTLFCGRVENKHLHAHLTQESFHCCADLQSLPAGECLCVGSVLQLFLCCVAGSVCSAGRGEVHEDLGLFFKQNVLPC